MVPLVVHRVNKVQFSCNLTGVGYPHRGGCLPDCAAGSYHRDMHFRFLYQPEPARLSTRSKRWTLDVDSGRWTSLSDTPR